MVSYILMGIMAVMLLCWVLGGMAIMLVMSIPITIAQKVGGR